MHLKLNVDEGCTDGVSLDAKNGDGPYCSDNVDEDFVGDECNEGMNYDDWNDNVLLLLCI